MLFNDHWSGRSQSYGHGYMFEEMSNRDAALSRNIYAILAVKQTQIDRAMLMSFVAVG